MASQVDLINVFRPNRDIPKVLEEIALFLDRHPNHKVKGVWLQLGITSRNPEVITDRGVDYVHNRCILVEHERYLNAP